MSQEITKLFFYQGGLAEIVPHPTTLTFSFLEQWFSGAGSLGKAMHLLGLPVQEEQETIFSLVNHTLVTDLKAEEKILYSSTALRYKAQRAITDTPQLTVQWRRILNFSCFLQTATLVAKQSVWIAKPAGMLAIAETWIDQLPEYSPSDRLEGLDRMITDLLWPPVIAIGVLAEFYSELLKRNMKTTYSNIELSINKEIADKDWFFRSLRDQYAVKAGKRTLEHYLEEFGLRADDDYELISPRWKEIPDVIQRRITELPPEPLLPAVSALSYSINALVQTVIGFQLLRSDARKKMLPFIDGLRCKMLESKNQKVPLASLSREDFGLPAPVHKKEKIVLSFSYESHTHTGTGLGVSPGSRQGNALHIKDTQQKIPGDSIGIFPDASPSFAVQYPQCKGLIFLSGGRTSHGVMVAREYGIPAIIAPRISVTDGAHIEIDGSTGIWKELSSAHSSLS